MWLTQPDVADKIKVRPKEAPFRFKKALALILKTEGVSLRVTVSKINILKYLYTKI